MSTSVVVVGGGVVGLSCAWRLVRAGHPVIVVDPEPGHGASWAAAGMLAPVTEASYGEERLLALGVAGAQRWPGFAAELAADAGMDPGLRAEGTLVVAHDAGDKAALDRYVEYATRLGLPVETLTPAKARALEPMLAPDVRGAVLAGDRSAHNRATVAALLAACRAGGVRFVAGRVVEVGDGVELEAGGRLPADDVVVAAGSWTPLIRGLEALPVRPVRGTILRLATPTDYLRVGGVLRHTLRGTVVGSPVYLVPREDGELVVGATSEEAGYDDRATAGGVWELLRDARALLPVVSELTFAEAWSGLRPTTPDHVPLVGRYGAAVVATGHGRNGILLSPVTADAVVELVEGRDVPEVLAAADPARLATVAP